MMRKYRVNVETLARLAPGLVHTLSLAGKAMLAREVGKVLQLAGSHEEVKRVVRDVVKYARCELGARVCANISDGYWLARSAGEWAEYQAAEKTRAIFRFVQLRDMREAAREKSSGQGQLFGRDEGTEGQRDVEARTAWARA